jgi:spermidine/putrescine transport system substrate-binding protein
MARRKKSETAPKHLQPFLSRRGFLKAAGVTGVAASTLGFSSALAGCSSSSADVVWSNWTLYMDVDDDGNFVTLNKFQEATGLTVEYNEDYNSNGEFWAQMLPLLESGAATGRDIVTPTDYMAGRWINRGYAQELNKANMPNSGNLIAELLNPGFDPGRRYTMPWQSGYGGLGWNKEKLQEAMGISEMTTVDQLFDPRLRGQVVLLSEMRDTLGVVMAWQGADPANFTSDQFYNAIDFLQSKVDDGHIQSFQGNDYAVGLENGDITAVIGWSGDLVQLGDDFGYANPETGANLWTDNLLIPVGAENKENAEKLIDWYYRPEIAAELAAWVNYISPVEGAKEAAMEIDPELADNPLIFPTDEDLAKTFIFKSLSDAEEQEYEAAFERLLGN